MQYSELGVIKALRATFGRRLRIALIVMDMTQAVLQRTLADEEDFVTTKQSISHWCRGQNFPSEKAFQAIARVFGRRDPTITTKWLSRILAEVASLNPVVEGNRQLA